MVVKVISHRGDLVRAGQGQGPAAVATAAARPTPPTDRDPPGTDGAQRCDRGPPVAKAIATLKPTAAVLHSGGFRPHQCPQPPCTPASLKVADPPKAGSVARSKHTRRAGPPGQLQWANRCNSKRGDPERRSTTPRVARVSTTGRSLAQRWPGDVRGRLKDQGAGRLGRSNSASG